MRRVHIAEMILALVSPGDRARATVGDLLEQNGSRVPWAAILHIAGAQVVHEWAAAPMRLMLEAFLLWLQLIGRSVIVSLGMYLLWAAFYVADNHTGLELLTTMLNRRVPLTPPEGIAYWMSLFLLPACAAWFAGLKISTPQRGLALWTASVVVWTFLGTATSLPVLTLVLTPLALMGGMLRRSLN